MRRENGRNLSQIFAFGLLFRWSIGGASSQCVCLMEKRAGVSGSVWFHTIHVMAGPWCQHKEPRAESRRVAFVFARLKGGVCRFQGQPSRLCPSLLVAVCLGLETDLRENTLKWVSPLKRMASVIPFANEKMNTSGWKWKQPLFIN